MYTREYFLLSYTASIRDYKGRTFLKKRFTSMRLYFKYNDCEKFSLGSRADTTCFKQRPVIEPRSGACELNTYYYLFFYRWIPLVDSCPGNSCFGVSRSLSSRVSNLSKYMLQRYAQT